LAPHQLIVLQIVANIEQYLYFIICNSTQNNINLEQIF